MNYLFIAILPCISASEVWAQSSIDLRPELALAARQVKVLLQGREEKTVTMLGVINCSTRAATILPGIESMLRREFEQLGILREENGDVGIRGNLLIDKGQLLLELKLTNRDGIALAGLEHEYWLPQSSEYSEGIEAAEQIKKGRARMDRDGKTILKKVTIKDAVLAVPFAATHAAAVAYGGTGSVVARGSDAPLETPEFQITPEGTLKLSYSSPYDLRIQVNGNERPIRSRRVDGSQSSLPEIELTRGETYTIELTNHGKQAVAATFLIDGINSFEFTDEPGRHGDYWVLPPRSRLSLKGWYKRRPQAAEDKNVEAFLVTPFEKTKRAKLGLGSDGVGAITVVLSKTRPRPRKVLDVAITERTTRSDSEVIDQGMIIKLPDGTGAGDAVEQTEGEIGNLVAGAPVGVLTIRYRRPVTE